MVKESNDHTDRKHWRVMLKRDVPKGEIILPAAWAMKHKQHMSTQEVCKWKAHLNLGGHKMIPGKHFDETYAPASWTTIHLFLCLCQKHGWKSRQVDFALACPQADILRPTHMELPQGVNFSGLD